VSYQIIEYFAIEQALFGILEIQVPASAAHGNWIDIYDASSQVAYCVRVRLSGFIVHGDIFTSVETLAGMKTRRRGVPGYDSPKKRIRDALEY
jgi:hypothetical protein